MITIINNQNLKQMKEKDAPLPIKIGIIIVSILYFIFLEIQSEIQQKKIAAECPTEYERINIYPKEYKALLIKKNESGGEGMEKKPSQQSLDLNNQGEIIHIPVSRLSYLSEVFDRELWEHIVEGDSIIKERNSYQVKVIRVTTFKIFDIDCEQFKKELESENK